MMEGQASLAESSAVFKKHVSQAELTASIPITNLPSYEIAPSSQAQRRKRTHGAILLHTDSMRYIRQP